jgi:hypothetical protein
MIQLVVYQAFIVRNMAHQGIRTERDPHSIPGQIVGSDLLIFIRGAIEGQNLELDLDETVFDDEVWREIYQQKERLFSGLDVIGWALLRMGFSVRLNDKIKKTHFENFPGEPAGSGSLDAGFLLYRKL